MKNPVFSYSHVVLILILLSLSNNIFAQKRVSGLVTDENGAPFPGVNVRVEGTITGVSTENDGKYSIDITNEDATLVFTFIGYAEQNISTARKSVINVSMAPDVKGLDEVVVIGYGTQSRSRLTISISKLNDQALLNVPRPNIGQALQGNISGLRVINTPGTPGAIPNILLRGGASIQSPGSPLVVVNGIIRPLNHLSPSDIASVEVLKDAASTAIFGARANNGVILVTTKQGVAGKSDINYKVTVGFNEEREGYKYLNARDYISFVRRGNVNAGVPLSSANTQLGFGMPTDIPYQSTFDIRSFNPANEYLLTQGWDTVGDPYGGIIIYKDHAGEIKDIVMRDTKTIDHSINISGGNEKAKYYASLNYYNEEGIVIGSEYKRYTGIVNGSYKIKPNIEVSTGANLSTANQLGVSGNEINNMYRNLSIWPTFNPWIDTTKQGAKSYHPLLIFISEMKLLNQIGHD